jgi:hypothetical protein
MTMVRVPSVRALATKELIKGGGGERQNASCAGGGSTMGRRSSPSLADDVELFSATAGLCR